MVSSPFYDNPHWEYHLPVNPPGAYLAPGDVVLDSCPVDNWLDDSGTYSFRPRLRDTIQLVRRAGEPDDDDWDDLLDQEFDY